LAKELVDLQPAVIVSQSPAGAVALQRETRTIPIVFTSVGDPIGLGLIANLARPGGNFTGLTTFEASISGKWLEMLREVAPRTARIGVVGNSKTTTFDYYLRAAKASASSLAIELVPILVESAADIEHSIEPFVRVPNSGVVVLPDPTTIFHRGLIIALAAHHRLPAVYPIRSFVADGGLMSYGTDRIDEARQSAFYVDRILKGEKPADLPVQAPTKFELVINLKTAKALGLDVPWFLQQSADEVIE
jgi:putative ABC transport system substrate-binding protein